MNKPNWPKLIAEQKKSNMNIAEFCRYHGLSKRRFYYYHGRLKLKEKNSKTQLSKKFVDVEIIDNPVDLTFSEFTIKLSKYNRIKVEGEGDPRILINFLAKREAL